MQGFIDLPPDIPQQPQTDPGRSLNLAASDPISFGGQFGSTTSTNDYAAKFGTALQGLLKQYQQLGTKPMQTQALNASSAQVNASNSQLTNPALQGYNPGTIMNASSAAAKPFDPIIQGANDSARTYKEQLSSFGDVLNNAQNLLHEQQAQQEKAQANAQKLIHDAMAIGSDALGSLIQNNPDLIKLSGYDIKTLQGFASNIKSKEVEAKRQFNVIHAPTPSIPTISTPSVTDPATDSAVAGIIASNPKEWGHAADAIDAQFPPVGGIKTSTKYDSWLKSVYQDGKNINDLYQPDPSLLSLGLKPIDLSRLSLSATRIAGQYIKSPIYEAVANGSIYLQRINAATHSPGSVSDEDLLDSLIKLNTGGNAVTEAQVKLITGGRSLSDTVNVAKNKLGKGGSLSADQRNQIIQLANNVYSNYQKAYTPIYNQATSQLKAAGIPQSLWTIPDWNKLAGQITASGSGGGTDLNSLRSKYNY